MGGEAHAHRPVSSSPWCETTRQAHRGPEEGTPDVPDHGHVSHGNETSHRTWQLHRLGSQRCRGVLRQCAPTGPSLGHEAAQLSKAVPAGDEVALPPSAPTDFENPPIGHTGGPVVFTAISRSESVASSAAKHLSHVRHSGRPPGSDRYSTPFASHHSRHTGLCRRHHTITDRANGPSRLAPVRNNVDAVRRVGPVPTWTVSR